MLKARQVVYSQVLTQLVLPKEEPIEFPRETTLGSMAYYITHAEGKHFQPMNANFGLFPELPERIRDKKERYEAIANLALDVQAQVIQSLD